MSIIFIVKQNYLIYKLKNGNFFFIFIMSKIKFSALLHFFVYIIFNFVTLTFSGDIKHIKQNTVNGDLHNYTTFFLTKQVT